MQTLNPMHACLLTQFISWEVSLMSCFVVGIGSLFWVYIAILFWHWRTHTNMNVFLQEVNE
jgi:hypothetical protein